MANYVRNILEKGNKVNQPLITLIIVLAVFGITARAFCYQADVTDISGNKYFPAVNEAITKAEKSINVVMFAVESSLSRLDSKPNKLINALIEAKNRGVDVEVILDQNIDFVQRRHASDWEAKIKCTRAYKRFKEAGIKVYYDEPARYTHAKAVIIDKKIVILGSTNWTESSFDNNIETSVLINSPQLAEEILAYLKTIKIDTKIDEYLDTIGPSVPLSWEFIENPKLAPLLIKDQAERAFDVYLYLLWKYDGNPQAKLTLFYDDLAKYLGIYEGWTSENYRRQIIKVFKKLEQKYRLLKFEPRYAKEAAITLLNYDEGRGIYAIPDEQYFELPDDYFKLGWNRELSLRAKFCYLINLANTDISDIKPYWSKSVNTITKQFGDIGQDVINKGMGELRRKSLLEVKYDELSGKLYEQRRPKMYKLLKLYDPKVREAQLGAIEEKYSKEAFTKARKYAEIVFEENNPEVIEDIILKTKEYGAKEIKRVFDAVSQKNIDNPKRTYIYVTRIIGRTE
ncbi:MAG: phospholipase D-like domain-containing protein [Patescibacteria group bacterium]